ncbi:RluA family pseudouridine synthase [Treponema primitia]|uniref:RluA family pseudouridine synthase n=1 Tax=Treponema primitia TaxID=88058 RepID=UPI00397ED06E
MTQFLTLTAAADDDGRRLDRILRKALPDIPLSAIHSLLRKRRILVDGVPGKPADRVRTGAAIRVPIIPPDTGANTAPVKAETTTPAKKPPDLEVLREAAGLLVLNKPAGLTVHGPDSLEEAVQAYLAGKISPSLSFTPGPLHRLDRPTSGIIVFSTSIEGARNFSALLRERRISKTYLALLDGLLDRDETWEDTLIRDRELGKSFTARETSLQNAQKTPLQNASAGHRDAETGEDGFKDARTRVYPLTQSTMAKTTLARLEIDTGRTHQIRAQAAAHGHPLAGDRKYGGSGQQAGFLLHAWTLDLPEQSFPEMPPHLEAPLPKNFQRRIQELFGDLKLM